MLIIDRIVSQVGRRVDESSPMVDARLPDGSRINAIIPPLALDGPSLSIRRFGKQAATTIRGLVEKGSRAPAEMVEFLHAIVQARASTLSSAAAPARAKPRCSIACRRSCPTTSESSRSKTPPSSRSSSRTWCAWKRGPPTSRARARSRQRDLVKKLLRMRPDRIIVGEVRGAEVFDMLQAMSTGHDGSIATIHANTPRECDGAARNDDAAVGSIAFRSARCASRSRRRST